MVARRAPPKVPTPTWHAPWELSSVVSGHLGWVRSIAFDPSNEWFATGSTDRTIKVKLQYAMMIYIYIIVLSRFCYGLHLPLVTVDLGPGKVLCGGRGRTEINSHRAH